MEKKRKTRNVIAIILLLAIAAGLAALPTILKSRKEEPEEGASTLSAKVERKTIRSTISGGGTLTQENGTAISVLKGVEISRFLVANGDLVEKGQPVALVEPLSLARTIATLQANLDYIARQLISNPDKTGNAAVNLPAPGRVKEIYAAVGDKVSDVMAEHGCLAVVSLDGLMGLEIESEQALDQGRDLTVKTSDGKKYDGRVEVRQGNRMFITLTDDGPRIGDTAEVFNDKGESLGTGTLYVHSAWNVTAVSGEVGAVYAKVDKQLPMNGLLFNLKNVDFSQENRRLSAQRREYEDALNKLFALNETGVVTAPADGRIFGLDTSKAVDAKAGEEGFRIVLLAGGDDPDRPPSPERDKPSKYKNYSAVVSKISYGKISFLVEKEPRKVRAYTDAPQITVRKARPFNIRNFSRIPMYALDGKKWKQIGPEDLEEGEVLYFVKNKDGDLLMIVRSKQPKPDDEGGGSFGGGGGGGEPDNFEMYELTDTELMKVVPQNKMTVQVSIDELDILSVAQGQTAEITLDALPGRAFNGTVTKIDPKGKNTGGNTRYTITITVDRDDNMLPGMNATAILTTGQTENVLTIPAAALCQRGSSSFVYTGYDSEKKELTGPVDVELGVSDGQTVEIRGGLSEGDQVWYSYYETEALPILFDGADVDEA